MTKKIAFVFPGQGSQSVGMGKDFFDKYQVSKETYEEANEVFGEDISSICFNGGIGKLNKFTNMQVAIVVTSIAIYRAFMNEYGIVPKFAAGHSIGEYAALVAAGALSLTDAVRILKKRGELVEKVMANNFAHMSIIDNASLSEINEILKKPEYADKVFLSCDNASTQLTLSGFNRELAQMERYVLSDEMKVTPLLFSPAMHSPIMQEMVAEFKEFLETIAYHEFNFPIACNLTGALYSDKNGIPALMSKQLTHPVQWR